jgi:hypothetical protein
MKNEKEIHFINKVEWKDFDENSDNDGYIFSIAWEDYNGNNIDIEWYKSEKTRDVVYKKEITYINLNH